MEAKQNVQLFRTLREMELTEMYFMSHPCMELGAAEKVRARDVYLAKTTWPCALCVSVSAEIFTATKNISVAKQLQTVWSI